MGEADAKVHPSTVQPLQSKYKQEDDGVISGETLVHQNDPSSSLPCENDGEESDEEDGETTAIPNLPFWNEGKRTINPTSHEMAQWDKTIMMALLYTALVTPFEVAFLTPGFGAMFVINRTVDTIFLIDICFTFYLDPSADESLKTDGKPDHSKIACAYLSGWFLVDVISCIPFDLLSIVMEGSALEDLKFMRVIRLLRLIKLVRLLRATRMFDRWEDSMAIDFAMLSITKSCCLVALFSHWFACMWYITYYIEEAEENWITSGGFEQYSTFDSYIASLYFSVMTMSTIGYGDISPVTSAERIVACIMMLVGAGIYAYVVGSITSTVQTMEASTQKYQELMDQLNLFLEENQVSTTLRVEARRYFRTRHQAGNLVDWRELLAEMSPDLREQIASESHDDWCAGSNYFHDAPKEFRAKAAALFKEVTFPKGEQILEIGQNVDEIFVIKSGAVATEGKVLTKGCLFGESAVLDAISSGSRRSVHTATALTFAHLQSLDMQELLELLEEFPEVKRKAHRASLRAVFRSHVLSYASAARELDGQRALGVRQNRELIEHYKWKLEWLIMDGTRGAQFFKNVIKLQASWRGHMGRKRALSVKDSLSMQLRRTVARSMQRINTQIEAPPAWGGGMLQGQSAGSDDSTNLMEQLLASLDKASERLTRAESQNGMMQTMLQRLQQIDNQLKSNSQAPPLLGVRVSSPPPLPMKKN